MIAAARCVVMTIAIPLVACYALAQEVVPTPEPEDAASANGGNPAADQDANQWRYRFTNGRWWYWTPENRWMWYSDAGRWVAFDTNHAPPADVSRHPGNGYKASYPDNGHWHGNYPGVAVGVWPYGNVDVNVGRRIEVDVAGPHGAVRVGRIYIGW